MKYENMRGYSDKKFRRITGVKRKTFEKMLEILRPAKETLTSKGGPKPKLDMEEMLLATLEYLREYRTYAHVAASYGVSESSIFRHSDQRWDSFTAGAESQVVLIDAAESPIERPKRGSESGIRARKMNRLFVTPSPTESVMILRSVA